MDIINLDLLYKYINQKGLNTSELARDAEISRNTIYNISEGHTAPSHTVIEKLANFLEITQEDFMAIFFPKIKF